MVGFLVLTSLVGLVLTSLVGFTTPPPCGNLAFNLCISILYPTISFSNFFILSAKVLSLGVFVIIGVRVCENCFLICQLYHQSRFLSLSLDILLIILIYCYIIYKHIIKRIYNKNNI